MMDLLDTLGRLAATRISDHYGAPEGLPEVLPIEFSQKADLQSAGALQLAKRLQKPPREVAEVLASALKSHEAVRDVQVAGPGFVNVFLDDAWLASHVASARTLRPVGAGKTVVIDYSSPNVAKPMHIAHIRSTIIGDALKRILRATGYTVVADNHLGDWGTQFGKLIVAFRKWVDTSAFEANPVEELLRLYVKFVDEEAKEREALGIKKRAQGGTEGAEEDDEEGTANDGPPLLQEARAELVKLQQGDPANVALWKQFIEVSQREFDRVYKRLGVTFDVTLGESFYNDRLASTVDSLVSKGIAEESEGAIVVRFEKQRDGESLPPFLIRKKDGGFLYGTTDIAGVLYRVETWNPARIIYVTDERQQLHFRQLFATVRRLGTPSSLEHVWFGLMRMPEGTISTRAGRLIGLEALLDEAERRARVVAEEINAKSDDKLTESEVNEVARIVGMGAVKYNDLCRDRTTLVTFTWDKALALTGNTAPYLQYAFARTASILRKAATAGATPGPVAELSPLERQLVLKLMAYGVAVEGVARSGNPHILCEYLFELATAFSTFYNELPVLRAAPALQASRLTLTTLVGQTLSEGLGLLGIEVAQRM